MEEMSVLIVIVIAALSIIVVQIHEHNYQINPIKEKVFKEIKGKNKEYLFYEVNWEYMYNFSIKRQVKALYKVIKKSNQSKGNFEIKIGERYFNKTKDASKQEITKAISEYRNIEISKYEQESILGIPELANRNEVRGIFEFAKTIKKAENLNTINSITKTLWLIYADEDKEYKNLLNQNTYLIARLMLKK